MKVSTLAPPVWDPGITLLPEDIYQQLKDFRRREALRTREYAPDIIGIRELKQLCREDSVDTIMVHVQQQSQNEYRNRHLSITNEFSDVLVASLSPADHAAVPPVQLRFEVGTRPHYIAPYAMSAAQLKLLKTEVERLLYYGYVEPSSSPWGSPVIFVPKKNGQMRMCIDYRALNKKVIASRYPIPSIQQYLEKAARYKRFSLIDLKDGYHQLRLSKYSQACTAFSTPDGHYQFTRLPFGLNCAPMEFQRAMMEIFPSWLYPWVQIYLDDILILADNDYEAKQRLRTVLTIMRHHGLRANLNKSELIRSRIHYLGHTIQHGTIGMEPEKIRDIMRMPTPTSVRELRSFLGMANYYSRFVPRFASLAAPLYEFTGKHSLRGWRPAHSISCEVIKRCLARMLLLHKFEEGEQLSLRLFTDASDVGLGAVIENSAGAPIAFWSRKLTGAERSYSIYEKELLALVSACEKWRHMLIGSDAQVHVDNQALHYLRSNRLTNPRVARWAMRLSVFGLETNLLATEKNVVADYLSRYIWAPPRENGEIPFVMNGLD